MLAYNARPPDPALVGDGWRELWLARLEGTPPFVETWLAHQRRDDYWKQGSVCEDYARSSCPVYVVGGWADGYTNASRACSRASTAPCKGLIGPWAHGYPHDGRRPARRSASCRRSLRWWDHWLKGERDRDHGRADAARLDAGPVPPASTATERPGRWVAEARGRRRAS